MPLAPPPHHTLRRQDVLSPVTRRALVVGVVSAQAAAAWALLQLEDVRRAVADVVPVWIQPEVAVPPPPPPAPPPPPVRVRPPPKRELPIVAAPPAPAPPPDTFEVPRIEPTPAPPEVAPAPAP